MKKKIFLNGLNSKVGGGKSILKNYLALLKEHNSPYNYVVLTPNRELYKDFESDWIKIIDLELKWGSNISYLFLYQRGLAKIIKEHNCSIIFNLSDIPIVVTNVRQIFLFDWSYAVYPNSKVWKMMDLKNLIARKTKLFFFKKNLKYVNQIIAQTPTMKEKLEVIYGLKNIKVVPNAVSVENLKGNDEKDFNLPDGIRLLYLTYYYPHKNLEIFIPLAEEIKNQKLNYKLIVTVDSNQSIGAITFLNEIKNRNLQDIIINVGSVPMKYVPSLYRQCDGLLMPTLLESFSGTYVEAMYHKKPILTSNLSFAKGVCFDAATYFDPFNQNDILESINEVFTNQKLKENKIDKGLELLNKMPNWEEAFKQYNLIIEREEN
jgi:glycosyltransferase involved in cell wall biosynthesis